MKNIIEIDGHRARVHFDREIKMLRGEFLNLAGGADFYAADMVGLMYEGRQSLSVYQELCREKSVEPF